MNLKPEVIRSLMEVSAMIEREAENSTEEGREKAKTLTLDDVRLPEYANK